MSVLIYILKGCIAAIYAFTILKVVRFVQSDKHVKVTFDTLSSLELAAGAGLALISLGAVVTDKTSTFTLGISCLSIVVALWQSRRIILVGDRKAFIKWESINIRDIKKLDNSMLSLYVITKEKKIKIYVPLTGRNVLRDKIVDKLR